METQIWIIGQIAIDAIMVALLLWFLKFQSRRQISWQEQESLIRRSESILSEMREITLSLEKNLDEKRTLSRQILEQLDQGLMRAEASYKQFADLLPRSGNNMADPSGPAKDTAQTRNSVYSLLKKGLSKEEIARHLGISVGEIDLMLKLHPSGDFG